MGGRLITPGEEYVSGYGLDDLVDGVALTVHLLDCADEWLRDQGYEFDGQGVVQTATGAYFDASSPAVIEGPSLPTDERHRAVMQRAKLERSRQAERAAWSERLSGLTSRRLM